MYLTDLAFIEEGTPNFTEEGLVNFSKMRMVSIMHAFSHPGHFFRPMLKNFKPEMNCIYLSNYRVN